MKVLVTGVAGFIGYHLSQEFIKRNIAVVGIDKINSKKKSIFSLRLSILKKNNNFIFKKVNISKYQELEKIFVNYRFTHVINLAAETGVRNSIKKPEIFLKTNLVGFYNVLNLSKIFQVEHFIFASSSSVYGNSKNYPTSESDISDLPISFYAATKKSNELISYSYSKIYNMNITGIRFFTVYGPFGRPDMAIFYFFNNILNKKTIEVYNNGNHIRDFTYIDDVVSDIFSILNSNRKRNKFEVYNIGGGSKTNLKKLISIIEKITKTKAIKRFKPIQRGDVIKTFCNNKKISLLNNNKKYISINRGLNLFYDWYKEFNYLFK